MIEQTAAVALLQQSLRDISTGWSLGTFEALAEFHHVASDLPPLITLTSNGGEVITGRGAMRAAFCEEVLPLAYEGLTQDPRGWNQTLSFCLRTELARMAGRAVLMELGPDKGAIREADREAILFDLGVDAAHVDFCVRTDDPELVAALRQAAGQSVLEPGHPALAAIAAASAAPRCHLPPGAHRGLSADPDRTGRTLTDRPAHSSALRNGRTHSANAPIPRGWTPALNLHPPSPITDSLGHRRPFAADGHAAFQALLRAYAPPGAVAEKHRITRSVLAGERPQHYLVAPTRAERKAARVALRQMLHTHPDNPVLPSWLETFDRGADAPDADA